MAQCDKGYCCDVCGHEVTSIAESDLYLRYVLGEVRLESLHRGQERHVRCHPELAQFIVDPDFQPLACFGPFAKLNLDPSFVHHEELRVTRGWRRLQALPLLGLNITEYPLSITPDRDACGSPSANA